MADDLPPLPDGWQRTTGKTRQREGKWHIQLRGGFSDTRVAYDHSALHWIWGYHAGDIVAPKRAE